VRTTTAGRPRVVVIILTGTIAFAAALFLDTGALLHLLWTALNGKLGFGMRLAAYAVVTVILLPPLMTIWRRTAGSKPPKRAASKKQTPRSRRGPEVAPS
jgi:hypothetical protein